MDNTTLIIVGMHRSGTSLITNWLNKCGLELGEQLLGPNTGNTEGHFEDIEFLRLHEEILADNNLPTTGLTAGHNIIISPYNLEKLKSVIGVKNLLYKQWGFKDPRTCLFLDTYKELLPGAKYLVVVRDYRSVVSSLLQRDFKDIERKYLARKYFSRVIWKNFRRERRLKKYCRDKAGYYLRVYVAYMGEIVKSVKALPPEDYLVLNYAALLIDDKRIFSYLTEQLGLSLNYVDFKGVYNNKLMNEPIDTDSFVPDRSLISTAVKLENNLKSYMVLT